MRSCFLESHVLYLRRPSGVNDICGKSNTFPKLLACDFHTISIQYLITALCDMKNKREIIFLKDLGIEARDKDTNECNARCDKLGATKPTTISSPSTEISFLDSYDQV